MNDTANLELLPWDSRFLGFGVARLLVNSSNAGILKKKIAEAQRSDIQLLYLISSPDDTISNTAVHQAGALLVDRKATFLMSVDAEQANQAMSSNVHSATVANAQLESLALQSGVYSRFRLDNHFAPGTYKRLYHQWLHNSLARTLACEVLVYQPSTIVPESGLLTLGLKQGRADIGLLAVDSSARGRGIGTTLVQTARQFTATWQLSELQVVTQLDNQAACAFYQHCGFKVHAVEYVYHLWLPA